MSADADPAAVLASILSLPLGRTRRLVALAAAVPIFLALGVMRVLVLAVPAALIGSPLVVVHGFFQIVTALAIVAVACRRTPSEQPAGTVAWNRYAGALGLGAIAIGLGASTITSLILWVAGAIRPWFPTALTQLAIPGDLQGVLVLAPAYQVGLLAALWFAWRPMARLGRVTLALAALVIAFVACLAATGAWLAHSEPSHTRLSFGHGLFWRRSASRGVSPSAGESAPMRPRTADSGVRSATGFPTSAVRPRHTCSAENERDLLLRHLPTRSGARLLKTDLWDEAKNTRILRWTASRGIDVYGLDLSMPTVRQAKREFTGVRSPFVVADVRRVPFASGSFDAIYSMGTIEHFDETEAAVVELARLLAPGGRLILGVPNRHDPFLRPHGGAPHAGVGRMDREVLLANNSGGLEAAGLTVTTETGILFIQDGRDARPALHTRWPQALRHAARWHGHLARPAFSGSGAGVARLRGRTPKLN
jgi:SAM-dependent methyltransferase